MEYCFIVTTNIFGEETSIGGDSGNKEFVPAKVIAKLEKTCTPLLEINAGADKTVTIAGYMAAEGEKYRLGVKLNTASSQEHWHKQIKNLIRAYRNWLVSFNPEYQTPKGECINE
ncbi:MAG: hypothetical protein WC616_02465 [Candidatus Omnitrophota bacterium]